jgi:hypothetical protein
VLAVIVVTITTIIVITITTTIAIIIMTSPPLTPSRPSLLGWQSGPLVEHLPSKCEAPSSNPSTEKIDHHHHRHCQLCPFYLLFCFLCFSVHLLSSLPRAFSPAVLFRISPEAHGHSLGTSRSETAMFLRKVMHLTS